MKKTELVIQESKEIADGGLIDIILLEEKIKHFFDLNTLDFKIKEKNTVLARLLFYIIAYNLPVEYTYKEIAKKVNTIENSVYVGLRQFRKRFLGEENYRKLAIKFMETEVTTGTRIRIIKSFKKVN